MFECLIVGDSIAEGISQHRKECVAYVKSGINSKNWNSKYVMSSLSADTVIISLGTNDPETMNTFKELYLLRQMVSAKKIMWVMPPIKPHAQNAVRSLAKSYGDIILEIPELSKDKVHPTTNGYKALSKKI